MRNGVLVGFCGAAAIVIWEQLGPKHNKHNFMTTDGVLLELWFEEERWNLKGYLSVGNK